MTKKKSYSIILVFVLFLAAAFAIRKFATKLFTDDAAVISSPASSLGQRFENRLEFLVHIRDLKRQNDDLADKLIRSQVDQSRISELENENKLLKQELGFWESKDSGLLVPARIIQRDPAVFLDNIVIDKGKDAGLQSGMAVISNGALVGQVEAVYDHTSKVLFITSKDSIIQAMLQDSRSKGILKGGLNGLFLENITQDTTTKKGEFIVTSGLGGKIKEGVLIGKAEDVQSSSGIFNSIAVEPIIDLSKLEIVFIQK